MTAEAGPESTPRTVRAGVDDLVDVALTVNGSQVALRLPARVTLADALRDDMGLTGTHLGCEHGVCGMCTVLVNGEAARACLLFAVQLDGADVVTVEGMGRPDDLHPLQESFGRNHALQCGFCTPAFLMSTYDLLTHEPSVAEHDLPDQLSGVICRCTGYRNILTAVGEVQREYPDGVPEPGNCGERALVGRATGQVSRTTARAEPDGRALDAGRRPPEIALPDGEPTVVVDVGADVDASPDQVWGVFDDLHVLARCLPGAELVDELGDDRYAGRARVSVGPVKLTFNGTAHVVEHDRGNGRLRVLASGRDTGGAQTQADVLLRTEPAALGTALRATADVYLTGRIAQFGRALAGDVSRHMFEQFAQAVSEAASSGRAPAEAVRAPGAGSLLQRLLLARIRASLHRLRRLGQRARRRRR